MRFQLTALDDSHNLTAFRSGNLELDNWLHEHARHATAQGTRTYVLLDDSGEVSGYFAIAPHVLDRAEAPKKIARGQPRQLPAILLAKLALAERLHGQGLGAELLVLALRTIVEAARAAGGKIIVVDAIDDQAAAFYQHHNLQPLPDRPDRLVMKLSSAAKALGVAWP